MRALVLMAEARLMSEWDRVTPLLALLTNVLQSFSKSPAEPVTPDTFNPYRSKAEPATTQAVRMSFAEWRKGRRKA